MTCRQYTEKDHILYHHGEMAGPQLKSYEAHLADCPPCTEAALRLKAVGGALEMMRQAPLPEIDWNRVRRGVREALADEKPFSRWRFPTLMVPAAASAAFVFAAALYFSLSPSGKPDEPRPLLRTSRVVAMTAQVAEIKGPVFIHSGQQAKRAVTRALRIGAGDALETDAKGRLAIRMGRRAKITIHPDSRIKMAEYTGKAIALRLKRGRAHFEVKTLPLGHRFTVLLGGSRVEVRGTAFTISRDEGKVIRVECTEGVVAVIDDAGQEVFVKAGYALEYPGILATATASPIVVSHHAHAQVLSGAAVEDDQPVPAEAKPSKRPGRVVSNRGKVLPRRRAARMFEPRITFSREVVPPSEAELLKDRQEKVIEKTMLSHKSVLSRCFAQVQKIYPATEGQLVVSLKLTDRMVTRVDVLHDNTGHQRIGACAAFHLKGLVFPEPVEKNGTVVYPFFIRPIQ